MKKIVGPFLRQRLLVFLFFGHGNGGRIELAEKDETFP